MPPLRPPQAPPVPVGLTLPLPVLIGQKVHVRNTRATHKRIEGVIFVTSLNKAGQNVYERPHLELHHDVPELITWTALRPHISIQV